MLLACLSEMRQKYPSIQATILGEETRREQAARWAGPFAIAPPGCPHNEDMGAFRRNWQMASPVNEDDQSAVVSIKNVRSVLESSKYFCTSIPAKDPTL